MVQHRVAKIDNVAGPFGLKYTLTRMGNTVYFRIDSNPTQSIEPGGFRSVELVPFGYRPAATGMATVNDKLITAIYFEPNATLSGYVPSRLTQSSNILGSCSWPTADGWPENDAIIN